MIKTRQINVSAYGPANLFPITFPMADFARECSLKTGSVFAFSIGSTGSLVTLPDDESIKDQFVSWVRRRFAFSLEHRHPGNAFAHLRSTFLGTGICWPVEDGQAERSSKQHVFLLENTAGRKARRISLSAAGLRSSEGEKGTEMNIDWQEFEVEGSGWIDIIDLTHEISQILKKWKIENGLAVIHALSEKTALVTLEHEPSLILDTAEEIARWFEGSDLSSEAKSHIASALLGRSLFLPVAEGYLDLGTWQQVSLVDLGNKGKKRILVQLLS